GIRSRARKSPSACWAECPSRAADLQGRGRESRPAMFSNRTGCGLTDFSIPQGGFLPNWATPSEWLFFHRPGELAIEVLSRGGCRPGLEESILTRWSHGSRGRLLPRRANDCASVHDIRRIKRGLDTTHRSDAADIAVPLQKMLLEPTDAVLCAKC